MPATGDGAAAPAATAASATLSLLPYHLLQSSVLLLIAYALTLFAAPSIRAHRKRRAWILTACTSFVMTAGSVPSVVRFITASMSVDHRSRPADNNDMGKHSADAIELSVSVSPWTTPLDAWLCAFFIAYLVLDLAVGWFDYREHVQLLTGWIHHSVYILFILLVLHYEVSTVFVMSAVMEAPTFVMSMGQLWKHLRHDLLFGSVYFLTRIFFHGLLLHEIYFHWQGPGTAWWIFISAAYAMHWHWWLGWVRQQKRRRRERRETKAWSSSSSSSSWSSGSESDRSASSMSSVPVVDDFQRAAASPVELESSAVDPSLFTVSTGPVHRHTRSRSSSASRSSTLLK